MSRTFRRCDVEFEVDNPLVVYWHFQTGQPRYLAHEDKAEFHDEMRRWRKLAKQGRLVINPENHTNDREYRGVKYYGLCVQTCDESGVQGGPTDPLALLIFGFAVDGMCYFFPSRRNRDDVAAWVMKGV